MKDFRYICCKQQRTQQICHNVYIWRKWVFQKSSNLEKDRQSCKLLNVSICDTLNVQRKKSIETYYEFSSILRTVTSYKISG